MFLGRIDVEAETLLATWCEELTHLKTLMLGKIEGERRGEVTEDEMAGWHHQLNGDEFE